MKNRREGRREDRWRAATMEKRQKEDGEVTYRARAASAARAVARAAAARGARAIEKQKVSVCNCDKRQEGQADGRRDGRRSTE